jgi:hypothetical protein
LLTVIDTWTSPYCVFSAGPLKVPDLPAGALAFGVLGAAECVAAECVAAGVLPLDVAGAVAECDAFGAGFLAADLDGDGRADALPASELPLDGVVGDVLTAGAVLAAAMPPTCVL